MFFEFKILANSQTIYQSKNFDGLKHLKKTRRSGKEDKHLFIRHQELVMFESYIYIICCKYLLKI